MRRPGAIATAVSLSFIGLAPSACEVNTVPPPLREVDVSSSETGVSLTTTTLTDPSELDGVERVRGHLVIATGGAVRLPDLQVVEGDLRMVGLETRPIEASLNLPKLARIGGNLEVGWTQGTTRITAGKLAEVGGHVTLFEGSWALEMPELAEINGDLRLANGTLESVALTGLRKIGGTLRVNGLALARGVELLLSGLEELGGDLLVRNASLVLEASRLIAINGDLAIEGVAASIALGGLREVFGDIRVEACELARLDLSALRSVGDDIAIENSRGAALEELELGVLSDIGGDLRLTNLDGLTVVTLTELTGIGGSLIIEGSPAFTQLNGGQLARVEGEVRVEDGGEVSISLERLLTIGGDLVIANSASFRGAFQRLLEIGGAVRFVGTALSFTGLQSLATIGGDLDLDGIVGSSEFDELRFEQLRSLGGSFNLSGSRSIEKLSATSLLSVGSAGLSAGDFVVRGNAHLIGLVFNGLGAVAGEVVVRDNPMLRSEDALAVLRDVESPSTPLVCGNLGGDPCP